MAGLTEGSYAFGANWSSPVELMQGTGERKKKGKAPMSILQVRQQKLGTFLLANEI